MAEKAENKISTFDKILITPPTERWLLWVISNDPSLFNISHLIKIGEKGMIKPNTDSNLGKALIIFQTLEDKGYIKRYWGKKDVKHKVKITIKGQWFRFVTNPSLPILIAAASILTAIIIALCAYKTNTTKNQVLP